MGEAPELLVKENRPETRDSILYDPIDMKFLEMAKLQGQKADWWLPRARGGSRNSLHWHEGTLWGDGNVL